MSLRNKAYSGLSVLSLKFIKNNPPLNIPITTDPLGELINNLYEAKKHGTSLPPILMKEKTDQIPSQIKVRKPIHFINQPKRISRNLRINLKRDESQGNTQETEKFKSCENIIKVETRIASRKKNSEENSRNYSKEEFEKSENSSKEQNYEENNIKPISKTKFQDLVERNMIDKKFTKLRKIKSDDPSHTKIKSKINKGLVIALPLEKTVNTQNENLAEEIKILSCRSKNQYFSLTKYVNRTENDENLIEENQEKYNENQPVKPYNIPEKPTIQTPRENPIRLRVEHIKLIPRKPRVLIDPTLKHYKHNFNTKSKEISEEKTSSTNTYVNSKRCILKLPYINGKNKTTIKEEKGVMIKLDKSIQNSIEDSENESISIGPWNSKLNC